MKTLTVGIMPDEDIRGRLFAIARGEYKVQQGEPRIWFHSDEMLEEYLCNKNSAFMHAITEGEFSVITKISKVNGRRSSNPNGASKPMFEYKIVDLEFEGQPATKSDDTARNGTSPDATRSRKQAHFGVWLYPEEEWPQ